MKYKIIRLTGLGIVVMFSLLTSGCFTLEFKPSGHRYRQEYRPAQYPLECEGTYYGIFVRKGVEYSHYYLKHYPWPEDIHHSAMGVMIPTNSPGEPVVIPLYETTGSLEPKEFIYKIWMQDFRAKDDGRKVSFQTDLPKPDSDEVLNKPARLFVTIQDEPLPDGSTVAGKEDHFLHILATRMGPGSVFRIGERGRDGTIYWRPPQVLNSCPTDNRWSNWWSRNYKIVTVPLDIATLPVQLVGSIINTVLVYFF